MQCKCRGDFGLAGFAASQFSAGFQQPWSSNPVDRAVDASASQQGRLGGVYDGVELEGGYVGLG